MSGSRDDQYSSHPIWNDLRQVEDILNEVEHLLGDAGVDAVDAHARIRSVARHVRSALDRSDPALVPLVQLNSLSSTLKLVIQELTNFASNGNSQHLSNAASN